MECANLNCQCFCSRTNTHCNWLQLIALCAFLGCLFFAFGAQTCRKKGTPKKEHIMPLNLGWTEARNCFVASGIACLKLLNRIWTYCISVNQHVQWLLDRSHPCLVQGRVSPSSVQYSKRWNTPVPSFYHKQCLRCQASRVHGKVWGLHATQWLCRPGRLHVCSTEFLTPRQIRRSGKSIQKD